MAISDYWLSFWRFAANTGRDEPVAKTHARKTLRLWFPYSIAGLTQSGRIFRTRFAGVNSQQGAQTWMQHLLVENTCFSPDRCTSCRVALPSLTPWSGHIPQFVMISTTATKSYRMDTRLVRKFLAGLGDQQYPGGGLNIGLKPR